MEGELEAAAVEAVETVLETVQENQEHANEVAEQIAEAALEGERGRRIAELERNVLECRSILDNLPQMIADQTAQSLAQWAETIRAEQAEKLSVAVAALANPPLVVEASNPPASIPPTSETIVDPATVQPPPAEAPESEGGPAKKKRHRFL